MSFSAVIFDVDGVLVDSPHELAWRETLDELMHGIWAKELPATTYSRERFDTALYQRLVAGKPRESGAIAILEYFHVANAKERAKTYAQEKQKKLVGLIDAGQFRFFPDAGRFVLDCLHQGRRLAVASSSKNAGQLLSSIPIEPSIGAPNQHLIDLFDANVSGREFPHGKPFPDIFLAAAEELHIPPEECLVVEDAVSGIIAAKAGGMQALGVARLDDEKELHNAHADLVVHSLDEVNRDALARGKLEIG